MVITIKDAINAGMNIEYIEREVLINHAEDWAPEQKHWKKLQKLNDSDFKTTVDKILKQWELKEYSNRYDTQYSLNSKLTEE